VRLVAVAVATRLLVVFLPLLPAGLRPRPPAPAGPPEPEVALVTTYPGLDPALLTTVVDLGSRGVVLEGAGPGNVPVDLLATIGELRDWGIPTVITSRARHATARLEDLEPPDGLAAGVGAIGSRGLPAHKATRATPVLADLLLSLLELCPVAILRATGTPARPVGGGGAAGRASSAAVGCRSSRAGAPRRAGEGRDRREQDPRLSRHRH
jgi:hypothetical protein